LKLIKHHCARLNQSLHDFKVNVGLLLFKFDNVPVHLLYRNSFVDLLDLSLDGECPLIHVLLRQACKDILSCFILDFETELVVAAEFEQFRSWYDLVDGGILEGDEVEELFLRATRILFVIKQLLSQKDKLSLLELVGVA
jgi:hypothetical protein